MTYPLAQTQARRQGTQDIAADSPMAGQETADEIAQIERELEILRSRQALMARGNRIANIHRVIALVLTPPLFAILVYVWTSDLFMAAFIFVMPLIVVFLIWIIYTPTNDRPSPVASDGRRPSQFLPGALRGRRGSRELSFGFALGPSYKSDAETIEDMIVLRKQRLAELKGKPPPSVPSVRRSGRTTETRRDLSKK
jgi:hypothetical protein